MNMPRFSLYDLLTTVTCACLSYWLWFLYYPFGPLLVWMGWAAFAVALAFRTRRFAFKGLSATMLVLGILCVPHFMIGGHAVPPYQLAIVKNGQTQDDVRRILGEPTSIHKNSRWVYGGRTWCYVTIHFDKNGVVEHIIHDH